MSPGSITPEQMSLVIGRAWESSSGGESNLVTVIVGLPSSTPGSDRLLSIISEQGGRIDNLETIVDDLRRQLNRLQPFAPRRIR